MCDTAPPPRLSAPVLLFILCLCGFSGALATQLLDPLITSIVADFATSVSVVALLPSAFALPFGLSQPFLGPAGDAFGKPVVIKVATAILALCLLASTRGELVTPAQRREQARVQVTATQQELAMLAKRVEEKRAKVSGAGSVRAAKPSSKPARLAAQKPKHES